MPRGWTARPPLGNIENAAVRSSGVTRPVPSDSDGTSGMSRRPTIGGEPQHRPRSDPLLQHRRGAVVRLEERRAKRQLIGGVRLGVARRPFLGTLRRHVSEVRQHRHRRESVLERRGVQQRLERRSRLPAAAARAVELRLAEVATADHREDVAGPRIDRDQRRLQIGIAEAAQPLRHRALRHLLQLRHERRPDFPVGRMVSAELIAKQLTQEVLRVAGLRDFGARVRSNAKTRAPGRLLLLGRDESLVAHPPRARRGCAPRHRRDDSTARVQRGRAQDRQSGRDSASVSCFAGLPNRCRDIVSTP